MKVTAIKNIMKNMFICLMFITLLTFVPKSSYAVDEEAETLRESVMDSAEELTVSEDRDDELDCELKLIIKADTTADYDDFLADIREIRSFLLGSGQSNKEKKIFSVQIGTTNYLDLLKLPFVAAVYFEVEIETSVPVESLLPKLKKIGFILNEEQTKKQQENAFTEDSSLLVGYLEYTKGMSNPEPIMNRVRKIRKLKGVLEVELLTTF